MFENIISGIQLYNKKYHQKLKNTCKKYSKINVPYKYKKKYKKDIDNLSKNKNIVILKQDKGRGVVILDTTKHMTLLNTERFKRLTTDPTAATERKIQNVLRKIKSKFSEQEYKRLYPTDSAPVLF